MTIRAITAADPECARGGGVSHILPEKRGVSFTLLKKMHENAIFSPTPATPYAGSATAIRCLVGYYISRMCVHMLPDC